MASRGTELERCFSTVHSEYAQRAQKAEVEAEALLAQLEDRDERRRRREEEANKQMADRYNALRK